MGLLSKTQYIITQLPFTTHCLNLPCLQPLFQVFAGHFSSGERSTFTGQTMNRLKTDLKSYVLPEDAKKENDPRASLNLKLKVTGPANVYAEDLKSQDPKIQPAYPKLLLVKLLKNQNLELEAKAILGKGKDHMKFSPGLAYYHNKYKVNVKQKDPGAFKNKYPPQIFDSSGKIDVKLINSIQLIDACKNVNSEIIEVKEEKDNFEFHVESWGQLEIKETFSEAIKIFEEKLDSFEKELKKKK